MSGLLVTLALVALSAAAPGAAPPDATGPGALLDRKPFRYARAVAAAPPGLAEVRLDADVLSRSSLDALRLVAPDGRQIPYLLEPTPLPLDLPLTERPAGAADEPLAKLAEPGRTIHVFELPATRIRDGRLVLETGLRVFSRQVHLYADLASYGPASVTEARWQHAKPERPAPPLELPLPSVQATRVLVTVDDGDNAPLPVTARFLAPSYRLRFFHPGTALELLYGTRGDDVPAPQYDLALLASRLRAAAAREVTLGPAPAEPAAPAIEEGPPAPSRGARLAFWIALGVSVAGLLALLARLLARREEKPG